MRDRLESRAFDDFNFVNCQIHEFDGSADIIGYHTCVQMSLSKASFG